MKINQKIDLHFLKRYTERALNEGRKGKMSKTSKQETARKLAASLFDLKLVDLEMMKEDQKKGWLLKASPLTKTEFEDIRQQVIQAKLSQQAQIGWQAIPHDLAVIVFCLVSVIFSLKVGLVAGIASLVLLESLFQVIFLPALYKILMYSVWLTYPAYVLLGYTLYRQNYSWGMIAGILLLAWLGTFVLGKLVALPTQLFLKARAQSGKKNN
jgi:hypothetical protein